MRERITATKTGQVSRTGKTRFSPAKSASSYGEGQRPRRTGHRTRRRTPMAEQQNRNDADAGKGAVEGDGRGSTEREQSGNTSLAGQNPHRTESRLVKSNDSDFPEPGGSPEHSGQGFTTDQHG